MPEFIKLLFTAGSYLEVYRNPDPTMVREGNAILMYDGNVRDFTPEGAFYLLTTFPDNFSIIEDNTKVTPERHEEILETFRKVTGNAIENKRLDSVGTGHQAGQSTAKDPEPEEDHALKDLTNEEKAAYTRAQKKASEGKQLTEFEEQVVNKVKATAKG